MPAPHRLIILGTSVVAEVAYELFRYDSGYVPVAFAVDREYRDKGTLFDLPVVAVEDLPEPYPPDEHSFFAAANYSNHNALRQRWYWQMKKQGYSPASFISPRAYIAKSATIGEHCFIFEQNVIQPYVSIGNNCILWSGNHIGHHSSIGSHTFIASHVVISGMCHVGRACFLGVNSTLVPKVRVGSRATVGAATLVLTDVPATATVKGVWKNAQA